MGKSEIFEEFECSENNNKDTMSQKPVEGEKRLRREIANSNERRRMQSINAGFQSLKTLLPHDEGDKLSKAAILQTTSDYITSMEQEKTRLLSQNAHLKRMLAEITRNAELSPPPKRKKRDTESSDEGIGMTNSDFDEPTVDEIKREMIELRTQLDRERRLRMMLEEQIRQLEGQLYPERIRNLASQVQAQMKYQQEKQAYVDEDRRVQDEKEKRLAANPIPVPQQRPAATTTTAAPQQQQQTTTTSSNQSTTPFIMNPTASSMSRRNLETIVEAIRHLEGDSVLLDSVKCESERKERLGLSLSSDSDMERDSCVTSDQELDECIKSEPMCEPMCGGRISPMQMSSDEAAVSPRPMATHCTTATIHVDSHIVSSDKYPIATELLHRPTLPQQFLHHHQRPGVIVHNLS
jgi:transcription factor AP-4